MAGETKFQSSHSKLQRVLAWIAIVLLVGMTITDFVLAILGVPMNVIAGFVVVTILIPIILFFFIKLLKNKHPESEDIKVPGDK